MKFVRLMAGAAMALAAVSASAIVNAPVPTNAFIVKDGLDWAWAFPLPAAAGLDLSYQSQFGWRLPTAAELADTPLATDFMFAGANVPLGGVDPVSGAQFSATNANLTGAGACATPYFSNSYTWCDWQDGRGQVYTWAGLPGAPGFADQLVVRSASAVPEPSMALMLALSLGGLYAMRRRSV